MGRPMATNLVKAGHEVTVWNRTPGREVPGANTALTPAEAVKEMERQLSINEDVLRYLTVRVDELELELSPILARRDRDRERRDDFPAKEGAF